MKKLVFIFLSLILVFSSVPVYASDTYIEIFPFGSELVLGEDLCIKGDTDFGYVSVGLFYPEDSPSAGIAKYISVFSAAELRAGIIIKTDRPSSFPSKMWPEGKWRVKVQNGSVSDEKYVGFTREASFDKTFRIAKYEDNQLISLTSASSRGYYFTQQGVVFPFEDGQSLNILFWNSSLAPAYCGRASAYLTVYDGDCLIEAASYKITLPLSFPLTFTDSGGVTYKIFSWGDNLTA